MRSLLRSVSRALLGLAVLTVLVGPAAACPGQDGATSSSDSSSSGE